MTNKKNKKQKKSFFEEMMEDFKLKEKQPSPQPGDEDYYEWWVKNVQNKNKKFMV
tara:strand:- start:69 stop:233 length:165 start_codon:yes stop_codon:yes gene_type:complete